MALFVEIPCPVCDRQSGVIEKPLDAWNGSFRLVKTCLKCEGTGEAWRFPTPEEHAAQMRPRSPE